MRMTPFEEFDRLFERMFRGSVPRAGQPVWYGCEMAVGPDGVPRVREYGNAATSGRQLPIDVIDDGKSGRLKLVAEIPGVEKEDIEVTLEEGSVKVQATRGEASYEGSVPLRENVDRDSVKAAYRNGILEVSFAVESRPKGQRVSVE